MSIKKEDGLRILKAEIKNFKNIEYREVDLDGRSLIIAGKNGKGKSALMQALLSPVNTDWTPIEPVKTGAPQGQVEILIGGLVNGIEKSYVVGMVYNPGDSKGRLYLKDEDGKSITSGQKTILNQIIGNISFDIQEFIRLGYTSNGKPSAAGIKEQIQILEGLMPKEVLKAIYALKNEYKQVYDERTNINRDITHYKGVVESANFSQEDLLKYEKPIDVYAISAELKVANETNSNIGKANNALSTNNNAISEQQETIKALEAQIAEKRAKIIELEDQNENIKTWLEGKEIIDTDAIEAKFNEVSHHNTMNARIEEIKSTLESIKSKEELSKAKTSRLEEIITEKKNLFLNADMPVKGLEFDEESITYNGLPLSEKQLPSSQLIGIGVRIGMALNPTLKVMTIHDGSLLDEETMRYVLQICHEEGYQLLIEVVDSSKDEISLEFIER